jgi:hypothetical protein
MVLERVRADPTTAEQGLLARDVVALLEGDGDRVPHWTPDARSALLALARELLAHPAWPSVVEAGLGADDTFWAADDLAQHVGVDTFPAILERLRRDPFDTYWWQAMQRTDETRLRDLLAIADEHFLRSELGSGPALELGFGPMHRRHAALESLVTGLERFPGVGWPHVRTALSSPVIRSRNMALRSLAAWGSGHWPEEAVPTLAAALSVEPDDGVSERIRRLLAGDPLDS